jgi:peptide/nickel transport system permease protein
VGLEFLGVGDVERVTWGTILYWARNDVALVTGSWWTFVPTGVCVGLVGVALALLGSVLDRVANPRLLLPRAYLRALADQGKASGRVHGEIAAATPVLTARGVGDLPRGTRG